MIFKKKIISVIVCLFLVCAGTAFGAFYNSKNTIGAGLEDSLVLNDGENEIKFQNSGGTTLKTMYVDSDYNLSLKDAPMYLDSNNNPIKWVCNYNGSSICLNDWDPKLHSLPSSLTFTQSTFNSSEISSESYQNGPGKITNEYYTYNSWIGTKWDLDQTREEEVKNNIPDLATNSPYVINNNLELYLSSSWIENSVPDWVPGNSYWKYGGVSTSNHNSDPGVLKGDKTIGLNDNTEIVRAKLSRDIIVTGNITIGGFTGFYGDNAGYSQINFNGFIIGDYCTLDLNGHDLIVTKQIDVWGQICDSVGTGTLVLLPNITMWTVFVVEDIYHEKRMPYTYFSNDNIFAMYRCPYWTCDTIIYTGANIFGKYRIDLGGDNDNYITGDIKLFGNSEDSTSACLFLINNKDTGEEGYILRKTKTRDEFESLSAGYKNNLLEMQIEYEFTNLDVTFNKFYMEFVYKVKLGSLELGNITANMDSSGYAFFVSPYYDINFYNCDIYLNQHVVFMPGSSLYIDSASTLELSYKQNQTQEIYLSGIVSLDVNNKHWQSAGGLTFIDKMYLMGNISPLLQNIATDSGYESNINTEGWQSIIYTNYPNFWSGLPSAYADIYGKIEFVKPSNITQYAPLELGGTINIYDLASFKESFNTGIKSGMDIRLYSSTFKSDYCRVFGGGGTTNQELYRSVTGYYNYPLISQKNVIMNPKTGGFNESSIKYSYDFNTRTIADQDDNKYAFIFATTDNKNMYLSDDINGYELNGSSASIHDSLDGKYQAISSFSNYYFLYNNTRYIYFNGVYIPCESYGSNTASATVAKFVDNTQYSSHLIRTFNYDLDSQKWVVS